MLIYNEHRGRYGYLRITLESKNSGYLVNYKKVKWLMNLLNLIGGNCKRKKYKSYKWYEPQKLDIKIQN
ncbi:IS3 family transposase [Mycoplasmopsis citelli]|uniref:IS3 family transposase n=1 Tax=Mycoplasmopsis citelli TaxID=171281 RepID=UPI0013EA84AD